MRIVRSSEPTGFTQVPNAALRDERLSYKARGIHANLLSNSDDGWIESADTLADKSPDGRHSVRTGLQELVKYGYVDYRKAQGRDGKWSTEMIVYTAPKSENPTPVAPAKTPTKAQVAPESENPTSDRSQKTRPRTDQQKDASSQVAPEAGYPTSENLTLSRRPSQKTKQKTKETPPASPGPPSGGSRGSRLPADFTVSPEMAAWAREKAPTCGVADHEQFCDYWRGIPGAKGRKLDWEATWRNWMRREHERRAPAVRAVGTPRMATGDQRYAEIQALRAEMTGTAPRLNVIQGELT